MENHFELADELPCQVKKIAYQVVEKEGAWIERFQDYH